jgi:phage antirepressor YoqD-like protein
MESILTYQGSNITFQNNGKIMVNANEMAAPFNKRPNDWLNNNNTQQYLLELAKVRKSVLADLVIIKKGGNSSGTWMQEDVALEFARWLSPTFAIWCNDRIKELLKHGATAVNPEDLLNPDFIINLATALKQERAERERLAIEVEIKSTQLALTESELQKSAPKVQYYEDVLQSDRLMPINVIANDLGISAHRLNHFLKLNKIIYYTGGCYLLTVKYRDKDYAHTRTFEYTDSYNKKQSTMHLYWTEKGREFIIGLWNKHLEASAI